SSSPAPATSALNCPGPWQAPTNSVPCHERLRADRQSGPAIRKRSCSHEDPGGRRNLLAVALARRNTPVIGREDPKCRWGGCHMHVQLKALQVAAIMGVALGVTAARAAPFMIVGNDEKVIWDAAGKPILSPPGKDSVLIVDVADPLDPKIVANLPLKNSVVGPPVNLDIDPTNSVALVADSMNVVKDGDALKQV